MNTSHIAKYAPKARKDFIAAATKQAAKYGVTDEETLSISVKGDVALIDGRPVPASIVASRAALVDLVEQVGFVQTMEQAAYSWFNRLCAIRYMELAGYLDHGRRVLSHPEQEGSLQILDDCLDIALPGLDKDKVRELKLDGTKDEELYRELLLAQCHALHQAMPFLFEQVDDATELLLPENLTNTDSLIRELVDAIPEEDWASIEIIGWLYQFYISEKKEEVIGKVVKSEDIPAATQLFTPNWIVKYMVQNSLGAQWLATYPDSPLKDQMEYYIEPAEQADEVNEQLANITPSQLNPEELTLIDPACGSGHILVEAYELFKAIYLERGYRQRDVPQLILEKNLFGVDIDERAAQLTGFALMMTGRADDRRLFERGIHLNVMALVDSAGFDAEALAKGVELSDYGLKPGDLTELKQLFEHATTFGSLIQVPEGLASSLPALKQLSEATSQDLFLSNALKCLEPLVQQTEYLAVQYDAAVANPPYMGSKFYCAALKDLVNTEYAAGKADLYAAFTLRNIQLAKKNGYIGMITIPNWMFLSSFEDMRHSIFRNAPISSLVHNGRGVWGADFGSCSYILKRISISGFAGRFLRLFDKQGSVARADELERRFHVNARFCSSSADFEKVPGSPVAYWLPVQAMDAFVSFPRIGSIAEAKQGLITGDNDRFIRFWQEVSVGNTVTECGNRDEASSTGGKWFPFQKGGIYRKWFGNHEYLVNWANDGHEIRNFFDKNGKQRSRPQSMGYYFLPGITWTSVTISAFNSRLSPPGFIYSEPGPVLHTSDMTLLPRLTGFLNSKPANLLLQLMAQGIHYNQGHLSDVAFPNLPEATMKQLDVSVARLKAATEADWNAYERSWDFQFLPLRSVSACNTTLDASYTTWIAQNRATIAEMKHLEEENNRLFIDAYGLADELTPEVPIEQITLTVNPAYRYGGKLTEEEQWTRFRQDTMQELISYAIGCMMGRYSLDQLGLIYAHSGNEDFDSSRYATFPADDDGIIPLTDTDWFEDDAANRLIEFMSAAWNKEHLEENLNFLAGNLSPKRGESSSDTIRRYLCDKFYKDHMQTYKKRPIYWLFSSGKQKAFQCLVYLHRYNDGTLSRMRTEYVIPLTSKLASHGEKLEKDKDAAESAAEVKRLEKKIATLHKQQVELSAFDEKLRHCADQRISLDLDDGVKVNYGKFGDLLADVKAVTGKHPA